MSGIPAIGTVRTLPTDDEARAWRAKLDAAIRRAYEDQMEAFRRAYEDSIGIERHRCLLSALALCEPLVPGITDSDHRVPKWLYKALCEQEADLLRQEHDVHWMRWIMVRDARRRRGLSWPKAYEDASKALKGTPEAEGTPRTMRESYRIVVNRNRRRPR